MQDRPWTATRWSSGEFLSSDIEVCLNLSRHDQNEKLGNAPTGFTTADMEPVLLKWQQYIRRTFGKLTAGDSANVADRPHEGGNDSISQDLGSNSSTSISTTYDLERGQDGCPVLPVFAEDDMPKSASLKTLLRTFLNMHYGDCYFPLEFLRKTDLPTRTGKWPQRLASTLEVSQSASRSVCGGAVPARRCCFERPVAYWTERRSPYSRSLVVEARERENTRVSVQSVHRQEGDR